MTVGSTHSSISLAEILSQASEPEILSTIFPEITSLPCLISSPLRSDRQPSFSIYMDKHNHVRFKDHGCPADRGGLLDLLCKYWNCTFGQALERINEIVISKKDIAFKPRQIKAMTHKEYSLNTRIEVSVRHWKDYDFQYWENYGITRKWLRYAEIYPISHKIVTKKNDAGREEKYIFTADKYAYCFVERKEGNLSIKIYQPFNTQGFKWCSKMDASVIGLWSKIPEYGDRVVICSSMKDALCLSCQLNIPALCLQGEGYGISDTAVSELKRRYRKVFICFDTDKPGLQDGEKLARETGFTNVVPDLGNEKDLSDYYKSLGNKKEFKNLEKLFY